MKAIIIAGGFGTRLRPLTYNTPKAIIPVANVPFILHQIDLIKKYGIDEIIINLYYLSDSIKKALKGVAGVKFHYSIEGKPLGTAGAVKNAEQYFYDEPLLIFNGDILTDINLRELMAYHRSKKAAVTLTLVSVEDPTTYGLVVTGKDNRVAEFIEKPGWEKVTANTINAGIYVIEPRVFREVPPHVEYSFERELFPKLLREGRPIYGYGTGAYWLDIGSPSKYLEAHRAILRGEIEVKLRGRQIKKRIWVDKGTKINKGGKIFSPAVIGSRCSFGPKTEIGSFTAIGSGVGVGAGSKIGNSVIWDKTMIGEDVHIDNCIIGANCRIEDGASIGGMVLADGSIIKKGSKLGIKL